MPTDDPEVSLGGLLQELLGCQWGVSVMTPDDKEPCQERAVQIVVLHAGEREKAFKLCAAHRDRVLQETTLHEDSDLLGRSDD